MTLVSVLRLSLHKPTELDSIIINHQSSIPPSNHPSNHRIENGTKLSISRRSQYQLILLGTSETQLLNLTKPWLCFDKVLRHKQTHSGRFCCDMTQCQKDLSARVWGIGLVMGFLLSQALLVTHKWTELNCFSTSRQNKRVLASRVISSYREKLLRGMCSKRSCASFP